MTPVPTSPPPGIAHISSADDRHRRFVLTDEAGDRIVQTGEQIVRACGLNISVQNWVEEFRLMLDLLAARADADRARIAEVYASLRSRKIVLFVVPRSDQFDFDLADELAEWSLHITREHPLLGPVDIRQVPAWELDRFIPQGAMKYVPAE